MKIKIFIICVALISTAIPASNSFALKYNTYSSDAYNYEIIIPETWKKEELTLSSKHFMYALKDANVEIKVRAFKTKDEDIDKAVHSETWDLRKIDPSLNKIIETEKITIKKNITGKILLFDYKSKNKNFLQRILISRNDNITYIIECISPREAFYKYEDVFTIALASFKYLSGESKKNSEAEVKKPADGNDDEQLESDDEK